MRYFAIEELLETLHLEYAMLRHLEELGLVEPELGEGGSLLYSERDAERARVASHLLDLGVNDEGLDVILSMRERMIDLQRSTAELLSMVHEVLDADTPQPPPRPEIRSVSVTIVSD